jgi:hypothetical protein
MVVARKISWTLKKGNTAAKDVKFGIEVGRNDMQYTLKLSNYKHNVFARA